MKLEMMILLEIYSQKKGSKTAILSIGVGRMEGSKRLKNVTMMLHSQISKKYVMMKLKEKVQLFVFLIHTPLKNASTRVAL